MDKSRTKLSLTDLTAIRDGEKSRICNYIAQYIKQLLRGIDWYNVSIKDQKMCLLILPLLYSCMYEYQIEADGHVMKYCTVKKGRSYAESSTVIDKNKAINYH